uniref:Ras-associating domain-containing protein n=1 Tax=Meloidogyne hapla TaxID=6305 RepID=A0A1I8BRY7_MELHA
MLKFQINSSSSFSNKSKQPTTTTLISSNSPSLSSIPSACSSSSTFSNSSNFKRNSRYFSSFSFDEEENKNNSKEQLLLPCKQLKCSCCSNSPPNLSPSPSFKPLNFNKQSPTNIQQINEFRHHLRIYTNKVRPDTDYKTLYLSQNTTTNEIIRLLVWEKLRLQLRDLNLFHLLMEIRTSTRNSVGLVEVRRNIIQLGKFKN